MAGYYSGTIQKGSSGDSVKKWQDFLVSKGYDLGDAGVDGIFGDATLNATKLYQKANGLDDDGIVGDLTWGKAGFKNINTPVSAPTLGQAPTQPTFNTTSWNDTTEGQTANQNRVNADNAYNNYYDKGFSYSKDDMFKDVFDKIMGREDFSYDLNGDALYQQYKDKYIQQGKMAMMDTMGQASAMTGGYGNSYAQTVGHQAYQKSLENLNDIVPELYQMAYDKYKQEGQDLYNQYAMLSDDKQLEYGMWSDEGNRLANDRSYYDNAYYNGADLYGQEQDRGNSLAQQNWQNEFNAWTEDNDNAQWLASWEEDQRRDQRDFDEGVRQFNEQMAASSAKSSSGGSGGSGGSGSGSGGGNDDEGDDKPITPVNSEATKSFKASIPTKAEFGRHGGGMKVNGKTYTNYNAYIDATLDMWHSQGKLTDDEVATLIAYYGL